MTVPPPPLLPPKYLPAFRAFLCHVKELPTPLLVQAAAAFGITLDATAVAMERAALAAAPRRSLLAGQPIWPGAAEEPSAEAAEAARYLSALRRVVEANAYRIVGIGASGTVPVGGYIGGVGRVFGVEVVGILPTALKELMAKALGQYNAHTFVQAMEEAGVLVADPKHPGKAAGLYYRCADGRATNRRHLCFRREAVLPGTASDDSGYAAPQVAR